MSTTTPLQELTPLSALARAWYFFFTPFWVSLVASTASAFTTKYWTCILVEAITGQLALSLIKLFVYLGCFFLGIAAAIEGTPYLAKFFRWSGERVASVAFDYSSSAAGVVLGVSIVSGIQGGASSVAKTVYVTILIGLIQFALWGCSYLAFGKLHKHFKDRRWLSRILGIALVFIFAISFYQETWKEIQEQCSTKADGAVNHKNG